MSVPAILVVLGLHCRSSSSSHFLRLHTPGRWKLHLSLSHSCSSRTCLASAFTFVKHSSADLLWNRMREVVSGSFNNLSVRHPHPEWHLEQTTIPTDGKCPLYLLTGVEKTASFWTAFPAASCEPLWHANHFSIREVIFIHSSLTFLKVKCEVYIPFCTFRGPLVELFLHYLIPTTMTEMLVVKNSIETIANAESGCESPSYPCTISGSNSTTPPTKFTLIHALHGILTFCRPLFSAQDITPRW